MPRGFKKGNIPVHNGKGKGIAFIRYAAALSTDECVLWPYSLNPESGYGGFGYLGKFYFVHRYMCRLVHGEKPTPKHEVRHSCSNRACVNPRHLSWATHSENMQDRRKRGLHRNNTAGNKGKLSPEQVRKVREMKGVMSQAKLGRLFGISESSVRSIFSGKTYSRVA